MASVISDSKSLPLNGFMPVKVLPILAFSLASLSNSFYLSFSALYYCNAASTLYFLSLNSFFNSSLVFVGPLYHEWAFKSAKDNLYEGSKANIVFIKCLKSEL